MSPPMDDATPAPDTRTNPLRDTDPGERQGPAPLRVGVSSCILGDLVRWNGAHMRQDVLLKSFDADVEWLRVCPEVEIGLGTPREPIDLVRDAIGTRLVGVKSGRDHTTKMKDYTRRRANELAGAGLDGYVLKSRSPSCGLQLPSGRGMFADGLTARLRDLPIVEETHLAVPEGRLHFVERMLALRRVRAAVAKEWSAADLADCAERHELQVVAHSSQARAAIDALVQDAAAAPDPAARRRVAAYFRFEFARALQRRPTLERRAGALRRARHRIATRVPASVAQAAEDAIRAFEERSVSFTVPCDVLRAAAERAGDELLLRQTFLDPEPLERRLQQET